MPRSKQRELSTRQIELVGAALRYCTVADWFEARMLNGRNKATDARAWATFNRVEEELRSAGNRLLRDRSHRDLVLEAAGVAGEVP